MVSADKIHYGGAVKLKNGREGGVRLRDDDDDDVASTVGKGKHLLDYGTRVTMDKGPDRLRGGWMQNPCRTNQASSSNFCWRHAAQ